MIKNYSLVILIYILLSCFNVYSQKEEYNWYFGFNAGLDFSTTPPTATTNSAMSQYEGCAVASDRDGNLMFYTNGINVYNKNHQIMLNGSGLLGDNSSTHSALIVSHPGNKNLIYIFTSPSQGSSNGLRYNIVDMRGDGGLGEVISKNNLLYTPASEKLLCVRHSNGKEFWVLTHELNTNRFRIYNIDKDGLNTTPTIQGIGRAHTTTSSNTNAISYIRANNAGSKVALAVYSLSFVEIFDFDNSTGVLSNPITLSTSEFSQVYGLEFSPDDTKLYVTKLYPPSKIFQIDLSSNDPAQMLSTMFVVDSSASNYEWGALKKAPDGKIYVTRYNKTNLSIINNPNQSGSACNFVLNGISLNNKRSGLGFPSFLIWSDGYPLEFSISSNSQICEGDTLKLFSTFVSGGSYNWTGPNGFTSNNQNPVIPNAKVMHSGDYILNVSDYLGNYGSKSIKVVVNPKPEITLTRNLEICLGDAVKIGSKPTGGGSNFRYFWQPTIDIDNPNVAEPIVKPSKTTKYKLLLENEFGCQTIDSVQVSVLPKPEIELGKDLIICSGDSIGIGSFAKNGVEPYYYKWLPEDGLSSAYTAQPLASPKQTTLYVLTVVDKNGCTTNDSILIKVNDKPTVNAGNDINLCYGESIKIPTYTIGGSQPYTYKWSNASTLDKDNVEQPIASPKQTTTYYLKVIDANGCINFDTITIKVNPQIVVSAGKDTAICPNVPLELNGLASGGIKPYQFVEWFPKENLINPYSLNPTFKSDKIGNYKYLLKVTDSAGCSAQSEILITVKPKAKLSINKNSLNFGLLDACQSQKVDSVLITNEDSEDISLEKIDISGDFKILSSNVNIKLKPKEKIYIKIIFSPNKVGDHQGKLIIITGGCENTFTIDLFGSKSELLLALDKNNLDFGRHLSCEDIQINKALILTNNGSTPITIDTRQIFVKAPFFTKTENKVFTLSSKQSISIEFEFRPDLVGNYSETITIPFQSKDCSDSLKVDLIGSSFMIKPEINLSSMRFPDLIACENKYDSLITIKNESEVDIELISFRNLDNFKYNISLPVKISAGQTISLPVSFIPKNNGQFHETAELIFEPCHITQNINLIGNKSGVSISSPNLVDFGNIITCNTKQSVQKIKIKNTSDSKITISLDSFKLSIPFSLRINNEITIEEGEEKEIEILLDLSNINQIGTISDFLKLHFSPCDIVKTIDLKANLLTAKLESDGFKDLGFIKNPTYENVEFYNKSNLPIFIYRIELDNPDFKLQDLNYPILLNGNETLKIKIELPKSKGIHNVKITAKSTDPCDLFAISERTFEVTSVNARTYVSLPDIWAKSGETIDIPLTLDSVKNSNDVVLQNYSAVISFSKYLLEPLNKNYEIFGDSCYIKINGIKNSDVTKILDNIKFLVLLGDTDLTKLTINEFLWEQEGVEVIKKNGSVRIINECYNTTRFVKNGESLESIIIKPNPVSDYLEIEFKILNDAYYFIYLSDINGKIVKYLLNSSLEKGVYSDKFSVNDLPSGIYNIVFISNDGISTQKVLVIK
ncbi:MAG: T9SS type A sorting domain-containing protein [Candidatus Kapabacteria bacterium]|nr:T9SS type A sorting domain-containing protein [Candidatus Kapabacteria bacterium]